MSGADRCIFMAGDQSALRLEPTFSGSDRPKPHQDLRCRGISAAQLVFVDTIRA